MTIPLEQNVKQQVASGLTIMVSDKMLFINYIHIQMSKCGCHCSTWPIGVNSLASGMCDNRPSVKMSKKRSLNW